MAVIISDDRYCLADGRIVAPSEKFMLDGVEHLNGVAGMSEGQRDELGIVEMERRDPLRHSDKADPKKRGLWTPLSIEDRKRVMLAELAARRWTAQVSGCVSAGVTWPTDDRSLAAFAGKVERAKADPHYLFRWKVANGEFRTLDANSVIAVQRAIDDHGQACFDREAELTDAINDAQDHAALDRVDVNSGWPV